MNYMMRLIIFFGMFFSNGFMNSSCGEIASHDIKDAGIRVASMRDRSILSSIKFRPIDDNVVDVSLWPFNEEEFAKVKTALGISDDYVYARGTVRLELSPDGTVKNLHGSFEVGSGYASAIRP